MRRISLGIAGIVLLLVELYLCTAFLPTKWQIAINEKLPQIGAKSYDYSTVTHPALSEEIESVLQSHPVLRFSLYAIFAILLTGNTLLLVRTCRSLFSKPEYVPQKG
jgi:hypothetical protein